jgi:hypothetical protein
MPRRFSSSAMARKDVILVACSSAMMGARLGSRRSCRACAGCVAVAMLPHVDAFPASLHRCLFIKWGFFLKHWVGKISHLILLIIPEFLIRRQPLSSPHGLYAPRQEIGYAHACQLVMHRATHRDGGAQRRPVGRFWNLGRRFALFKGRFLFLHALDQLPLFPDVKF